MLKFKLLIITVVLSFISQIFCSNSSLWYTLSIGNVGKTQYKKLLKQYDKNMTEDRRKIINMPRPLCIMSDCNNVEGHDVEYLKWLELDGYELFDKLSLAIQSSAYDDAVDIVRKSLETVKKLDQESRNIINTDIRICVFAKLLFEPISNILCDVKNVFDEILPALDSFSVDNFNSINNLMKFAYTDVFRCLFNCGHKRNDVIDIIKYMHNNGYAEKYGYDYKKHYRYRIIVNTLDISFDNVECCSCHEVHEDECNSSEYYIYESEESE